MSNEWMLDVLADLRRFADLNGMPRLSQELSRTARIAREEIVVAGGGGPGKVPQDEGYRRTLPRPVVAGQNA